LEVPLKLGLAIRVHESGSCQPDQPDFANGSNTNPTRLLIGLEHVTRTRPYCKPSNPNTTPINTITRREAIQATRSVAQLENKRTQKKNSHSAIMRNSPRKFLSKTVTKIPSTHLVPQPKTRRQNPKICWNRGTSSSFNSSTQWTHTAQSKLVNPKIPKIILIITVQPNEPTRLNQNLSIQKYPK